MNFDDYVLNAYKNAGKNPGSQTEKNDGTKVQSISKEVRKSSSKSPLIKSPGFERINKRLNEIDINNFQTKKDIPENVLSEELDAATKTLTSGGLIKVPLTSTDENDSLYRRVAKFLVIIGIDEAAKILPHLSPEQTEKIIPEIATIRNILPDEKEKILEEFKSLLEKSKESGGVETARNILTKAYGSYAADEIIKKSVDNRLKVKPFEFLTEASAERIKILLDDESDSVKTLVLTQLEPKKAAAIINLFEARTKAEVILRMSRMEKVAPQVLESVGKALQEKLITQNTEDSNNLDGRGILAQILKRMSVSQEEKILSLISDDDYELGMDLRNRLFTEEDFIKSDNRFIQKKLQVMADAEIAVLIRGKSDAFRNKILENVSKARGQIILDEESMQHAVLRSELDRITGDFYSMLRKAWESGELTVYSDDDGEVWV